MQIKPSAFSHSWYPGTARACEAAIKAFIHQGGAAQGDGNQTPAAGIVPHAGWVYSGRIACAVIHALAQGNPDIDTLVLFGGHMHPSDVPLVLASGGVDTPLGPIEIDGELAGILGEITGVKSASAMAFPDENTLELQYPFIRYFFPKAKLVSCLVPPSNLAFELGRAAVRGGKKLGRQMGVIGSTDMTHYGANFGFEPAGRGRAGLDWVKEENDAKALSAFEKMDGHALIAQGLSSHNLCCSGAAAATVEAAKKMGAARGICLDYATSYDVSGSDDSFVGYCGFIFPG